MPIIGDRRYGDPKHARLIANKYSFKGLAPCLPPKINYNGEEFMFSQSPPKVWNNFNLSYTDKIKLPNEIPNSAFICRNKVTNLTLDH